MTDSTLCRAKSQSVSSTLSDADKLSDFVHKIGHEIGNPLTAILSLATIIERYGFDPEKDLESQREQLAKLPAYAQSIGVEAWRVSLLSDRLVLLLSKRESHFAPIDLERCLSRVLMKVANRFPELAARVPATVDAAPQLPQVSADQEQLSSLIFELLLNAYQAADQAASELGLQSRVNCKISLLSRPDSAGPRVQLEIENEAPQACPFALEDLFLPFVTNAAERRHLGLGLSVAAAVAERLNLELEIEEEKQNGQCKFRSRVIFGSSANG